ncbi:MAG: DNA/RNA non-specific endonuclease [Catonella sp.]|uniref:DNA/RNA non-specific endonuclease n=1 Tax=Catonella sp. TaxID=2382125 RepID=UPI003F9F317F
MKILKTLRMARKLKRNFLVLISICGIIFAGSKTEEFNLLKYFDDAKNYIKTEDGSTEINEVPQYSGKPFVKINNNVPSFSVKDEKRIEEYSELDKYGRCGIAFAKVGKELMPNKKRESIGQVRPSGWHTVKYEGIIKDRYLYNRCHLIGYQLAGENANEKNLITGTRYLNVDGMLPFENEIAEYVKSTGNHVLYRVSPIFKGKELVARGVQMEAKSLEDGGKGVSFNVYCYNVQPGIIIDYEDGSSYVDVKIKKSPQMKKSSKTKKNKKK